MFGSRILTLKNVAENVIQENSTQSCNEWVKLCIDSAACDPQTFQIHSVGAYKRDSGSKSMETLETEFTQAMGGMAKYDPFMEVRKLICLALAV